MREKIALVLSLYEQGLSLGEIQEQLNLSVIEFIISAKLLVMIVNCIS